MMLNKLGEIKTTSTINAIRDYFKNIDNSETRMTAFILLKENQWIDLNMIDIIESDIQLDGHQYQYNSLFLQEINDSLAKFIDNIPTYVTQFIIDNSARNGLLASMKEKRDTLILNGFEIENIMGDLKNCMNNALDTIEYKKRQVSDDYYSWEETSTLDNIIFLTENIRDKELQELILQIPFVKYEFNPSAYIEYRIVQGVKVKKNEWEYMETYNYGFYNLISRPVEIDLKGEIPEHFFTEEKLSEIAFLSLMSDDWGEVEVEELLGLKTINLDEKEVELIFFIFKDNYDPKLRYVGCVELVNEENIRHKSLWNLFYDYSYGPVEGQDYEKIKNEIIKRY